MKTNNIPVLLKVKFKLLIKNFSAMVGSILAIFFSILFRITLPNISFDGQKAPFILMMVVMFNSVMASIMMISIPMAEEKEKKSLKLLISSSISQTDYVIATITPPFVVIMITNFILPFLSGVKLQIMSYLIYIVISMVMTLMSMIVGLLIGILCRKVSDTSYVVLPVILPLILIPQFATFNQSMAKVSNYLYTGILLKMLRAVSLNQSIQLSLQSLGIILLEFILLLGFFFYLYNSRGIRLEK